jgi:hypothetical protein
LRKNRIWPQINADNTSIFNPRCSAFISGLNFLGRLRKRLQAVDNTGPKNEFEPAEIVPDKPDRFLSRMARLPDTSLLRE